MENGKLMSNLFLYHDLPLSVINYQLKEKGVYCLEQ